MQNRIPGRLAVGATLALLAASNPMAALASVKSPDGLWVRMDTSSARAADAADEPWVRPAVADVYQVDPGLMRDLLWRAPMEFTDAGRSAPLDLELPMPDGTSTRFRVVESPIMEAPLAAEFPEIRTFTAQGIDDPTAVGRLDWTPAGFHGQILTTQGDIYIDPRSRGRVDTYSVYLKQANPPATDKGFRCLLDVEPGEAEKAAIYGAPEWLDAIDAPAATSARSGDTLRTYRIAVAATGEYTAFHGGTVNGGMAGITTTVNRVTGIYEREFAVRMTLVANNSIIVFTNASTDPFTNNNPDVLIGQSQTQITSRIGTANFDVGHTVSTGGGGLASLGVICSSTGKASGITGTSTPTGDGFDVDFVAHEIGHQFGGSHTFNGVGGSCAGGNRSASNAYEPGSGSTIQAYAGICGSGDNLQNNSDAYFVHRSYDQMFAHVSTGSGSACDVATATGNLPPTVSAGLDYTIPARTPFTLTATGSDPNGDALTYCWEERDLGSAVAALNQADNGSSPLFRTFLPVTSPARTFPRLTRILSNQNLGSIGEVLPTTSRTMNFRVTARDNRAGGGGTARDDMRVTVVGSTQSFQVLFPNTNTELSGAETITWNVANSSAAPVNCATVNILLSTDGGQTFPTVIASGVPNTGSANVVMPNITTTIARLKVEAVGNIFFDISNTNFRIVPAPPELNGSAFIISDADQGCGGEGEAS